MQGIRQEGIGRSHPRNSASFLSRIGFCWTIPTFLKGYKKQLQIEDLHGPLDSHDSNYLGEKLENAWQLQMEKKSLKQAIWRIFRLQICCFGLMLVFIEFFTKLSAVICLGGLLLTYKKNINNSYWYATFLVISIFVNVLLGHNYMMGIQHLGMKVRIACCSLIYRKCLKLNNAALKNITVGQMINLLSNDVNRLDVAIMNIHNLWVIPLQVITVMLILFFTLGLYALSGLLFFVCFIPMQMYLGKKVSKFRLAVARRTDERVRLMNEVITGIQTIKIYTSEKLFSKSVWESRNLEMKKISSSSRIRATFASFPTFLNRTAIFFATLSYVLSGNTLNAFYSFLVTACYNILRQSMVFHIPQTISSLAEASVSISRIEQFLLAEEVSEGHVRNMYEMKVEINRSFLKAFGVAFNDVSARWNADSYFDTLKCINLKIGINELVALVGTVGSGKSSLLMSILQELPLTGGNIYTNGIISYASQVPWIFPGTIRDNILFGQIMNESRFREVCRVCALETDFAYFPNSDDTFVGDKGSTLSGGQKTRINLARAIYRDADIYLLDDPFSSLDVRVGKYVFDECVLKFLKNKCVILATHQLQYLKYVPKIFVIKNGDVPGVTRYEDLHNSESSSYLGPSDNFEALAYDRIDDVTEKEVMVHSKIADDMKEAMASGAIPWKIYGAYIKSGGGYCLWIFVILLFVITQVLAGCTDYLIAYWVNTEQDHNTTFMEMNVTLTNFSDIMESPYNRLYIYIALITSVIVVSIIRSLLFIKCCLSSSKKLHQLISTALIHTYLNFFHKNSAGIILNRFSKDMGAVDEVLPITILEAIQGFLSCIGISVLVFIINPWMAIPTIVMMLVFYKFKNFYLASSRSIKRLEATTRSPVFSHISTSIDGLTTIRAFGAQKNFKIEFDNLQNIHSSAFYMYLACSRTFGLWLDLHCVIYLALVVGSFLLIKNDEYVGNVGLAITQSMSLTGMLQWFIRQWSELDNQMTSVERIVEYTKLPSEMDMNSENNEKKNWRIVGRIQFNNVSLKYSPKEQYVLKNLTFSILPFQKIGIVGRTGAGKTSLVSVLFRLYDYEGVITIDQDDIKFVSKQLLRSKISIIPQEPKLFTGTLRKNIDPFDEFEDRQIWAALKDVELERLVCDLSCGLDNRISGGGLDFSVGQRQLICLARAIIRNNTILIIDEATANVDTQTDRTISNTIRNKFGHCTVLTIAHRLHTVMDYDKVMVLDAGSVIEFDHPYKLLQNKNGHFYKMLLETGEDMAQSLIAIAEKNYEKCQRCQW